MNIEMVTGTLLQIVDRELSYTFGLMESWSTFTEEEKDSLRRRLRTQFSVMLRLYASGELPSRQPGDLACSPQSDKEAL